jgi:hypothetical protein
MTDTKRGMSYIKIKVVVLAGSLMIMIPWESKHVEIFCMIL